MFHQHQHQKSRKFQKSFFFFNWSFFGEFNGKKILRRFTTVSSFFKVHGCLGTISLNGPWKSNSDGFDIQRHKPIINAKCPMPFDGPITGHNIAQWKYNPSYTPVWTFTVHRFCSILTSMGSKYFKNYFTSLILQDFKPIFRREIPLDPVYAQ